MVTMQIFTKLLLLIQYTNVFSQYILLLRYYLVLCYYCIPVYRAIYCVWTRSYVNR